MFLASRLRNVKQIFKYLHPTTTRCLPGRGLANDVAGTNSNKIILDDEEEIENTQMDPMQSLADYLNQNVDYSSKQSERKQLKKHDNSRTQLSSSPQTLTSSVYANLVNITSSSSHSPKETLSSSSSSSLAEKSNEFAQEMLRNRAENHKKSYSEFKKNSKQLSVDQEYSNKLSSHFKYVDNEEEIKARAKKEQPIAETSTPKLQSSTEHVGNYEIFSESPQENNNKRNVSKFKSNLPKKSTKKMDSNDNEGDLLAKFDDLKPDEVEEKEKLIPTDAASAPHLTEEEQMKLDIKNLRPSFRPVVYNLAYFVNRNEVLQNFVKMGIEVRKWDKNKKIAETMMRLDAENHIKPVLIFFHDLGLEQREQAFVIEKNPMIFTQEIKNLNARIDYLKSKKFSSESIVSMVTKAPLILNLSVTDIDTKLGWFQNEFKLTGNEIRAIMTEKPKLITLPLNIPSKIKFSLKEFLCYNETIIKQFLITFPKMFTKEFQIIESNFVYLTQVCKLTDSFIATHPPILVTPLHLLKSRYAYLKSLDRAQFDPTQANFVSLKHLIEHDDAEFCAKTAKTSLNEYKHFLKTV